MDVLYEAKIVKRRFASKSEIFKFHAFSFATLSNFYNLSKISSDFGKKNEIFAKNMTKNRISRKNLKNGLKGKNGQKCRDGKEK